jgi:competence protein ComEA
MSLRSVEWKVIILGLLLGALVAPVFGGTRRAARKPRQAGPREMVDINKAGAEQLATVPGIGPKLARSILASRNQQGDFKTAEDLSRVKGVGPVNLVRIARYLTFPEGGLAAAAVPGEPAGKRPSQPIDLNIATASELAQLPGMGWGLAYRIIAERDSRGAYRTLDDLLYVAGVTPAHARRWAAYLYVEGHL